MPHPVQVIYEPYYRKFIAIFTSTLPYVYWDYKVGNNEEELKKIQLDFRLNSVGAHRSKLTKQSIKMINNSILFEKTGEVGLYLTYKCLYNFAVEYQNKA